MSCLSRLAATLPLCALLASPAAAQYFTFELTANFGNIMIDGQTVNQDFVLSGRTTTDLSDTPWNTNAITAPIDVNSLSLTYGGTQIAGGNNLWAGQWDYGLAGGVQTTNTQPSFRFSRSSGGNIDVGVAQIPDSLVFQTTFGGQSGQPGQLAWVGFGGGSGDGGRNWGITTTFSDEVVQFGSTDILERLGATDSANQRNATLVPEINGSGFAYIAFILGALGLWLYSGAGRREAEGLAAS